MDYLDQYLSEEIALEIARLQDEQVRLDAIAKMIVDAAELLAQLEAEDTPRHR